MYREQNEELIRRKKKWIPPGGLEPGDTKGKVLIPDHYIRWASDLGGAPEVPDGVIKLLKEDRFGIVHRIARPDISEDSAATRFARYLLKI